MSGDLRQRDDCVRRLRLGLVDHEPPVDPLHRLRDVHRGPVEVDVRPAQAQQLPATQAERGRQHVDGVEPGVPSPRSGSASRPPERHSLADLVARRRDLDELRDVARDQLVAYGVAQRVTQDGVHELDLPGRWCPPAAASGRAALLVGRSVPVVAVGAARGTCAGARRSGDGRRHRSTDRAGSPRGRGSGAGARRSRSPGVSSRASCDTTSWSQ